MAGPCHLAIDQAGRVLVAANYHEGFVATLPVRSDGTLGAPAITRIDGREIGVMRDPRTGGLIAIRNRCPHSGARLCLGTVEQRIEGARVKLESLLARLPD